MTPLTNKSQLVDRRPMNLHEKVYLLCEESRPKSAKEDIESYEKALGTRTSTKLDKSNTK